MFSSLNVCVSFIQVYLRLEKDFEEKKFSFLILQFFNLYYCISTTVCSFCFIETVSLQVLYLCTVQQLCSFFLQYLFIFSFECLFSIFNIKKLKRKFNFEFFRQRSIFWYSVTNPVCSSGVLISKYQINDPILNYPIDYPILLKSY